MQLVPLNPKIFDKDIESLPIRKGFCEGLLEAGEKDHRIVALSADLTESTQAHLFAKKFEDRFIQVGIAEQNLVSVASGMAAGPGCTLNHPAAKSCDMNTNGQPCRSQCRINFCRLQF